MSIRTWHLISVCFATACSSSSGAEPTRTDAGPEVQDAEQIGQSAPDAAAGSTLVHGTMVDFESLEGAQGLTITNDGVSATTDENGQWSLEVPLGAMLQVTVTSSTYSRLLFPDLVAQNADVDLGTVVIPDTSTYNFEEEILSDFDGTKSLVHIVILTAPTCASAVGGTVTVTSPSTAAVTYFNADAIPSASVTSFQEVKVGRPVAVVYNVDPTATLSLQVSHPTCTQAPFPTTYGGRQYPGSVRLQAAEPGGINSALVFVLQ